MPEFQTEDHIFEEGIYTTPVCSVVVLPGNGRVELQIEDDNGLFFTPSDASNQFDEAETYRVKGQYRPRMRLTCIGTAKFYVIGD